MSLNTAQMFERTASQTPNRTAIISSDTGERCTYREWQQRIKALAVTLADHGVTQGDSVGVALRTRTETATVFWATQYLGAAFTPYNVRTSAEEMAFLIDNTEPELVFCSEITRESITEAHEYTATDFSTIFVDENVPEFAEPYSGMLEEESTVPSPTGHDHTSVILHTSGTTGQPKGVPRSHIATYTSSHSHANQVGWRDGERTLGVMPIYHTMGLHTLTTIAALNGTWVSMQSSKPNRILEIIDSEALTSLYLVPTVFHDIIESYNGEADVSSVKRLAFAGMPMKKSTQERVRQCFEPEEFVNHYGSTEAFTYSTCSYIDEKPGCSGKAGLNPNVRIVPPSEEGTVPPNESLDHGDLGEIIVDASSPEVFDGYLNRPEADEESFKNGWYFTGDLGYRDEDGDLFVSGRVDNMIISGGENIHPVEVENVLESVPEIYDVAVVGGSHDRWNQVVTAFVVVDDTTADPELLASRFDERCRRSEELADFKRPREYIFIEQIPKSGVGKVLRRRLLSDDGDSPPRTSVKI